MISGERRTSSRATPCRCAAMPVGTIIHNVEMKPGKGGQIARSAGTYVQLVGKRRRLCAAASLFR